MRSIQRGITTTFIIIIILAAAVSITAVYFTYTLKQKTSINSFEACANLYPVMESYPEQCNTPDGKHFTRELSEEEKQNLNPPSETPAISPKDIMPSPSPSSSPLPFSFSECVEKQTELRRGRVADSKSSGGPPFMPGSISITFDSTIKTNEMALELINEQKLKLDSGSQSLPSYARVTAKAGEEPTSICRLMITPGVEKAEYTRLLNVN